MYFDHIFISFIVFFPPYIKFLINLNPLDFLSSELITNHNQISKAKDYNRIESFLSDHKNMELV